MRDQHATPGPGRAGLLLGLALGVWLSSASLASASEPLHRRIDRIVDASLKGDAAATATDAEFLRRVSLDLTGVIPTSSEAREFLDDPSPYKRVRLIDRLLAT